MERGRCSMVFCCSYSFFRRKSCENISEGSFLMELLFRKSFRRLFSLLNIFWGRLESALLFSFRVCRLFRGLNSFSGSWIRRF